MIHTQYACLDIPGISSKEQLVDLLRVFAQQILEMNEVKQDSPFRYLQDDVEGLSQAEAICTITNKLLNYINLECITS